jgi:phosphatidylserine decarboxylase
MSAHAEVLPSYRRLTKADVTNNRGISIDTADLNTLVVLVGGTFRRRAVTEVGINGVVKLVSSDGSAYEDSNVSVGVTRLVWLEDAGSKVVAVSNSPPD